MEILLVLAWAAAVVAVGYWANELNRNPIGWSLIFIVAPLLAIILLPVLGRVKTHKFCPECGSPITKGTGQCDICNSTSKASKSQSGRSYEKTVREEYVVEKDRAPLIGCKSPNFVSKEGYRSLSSSLDIHKIMTLIEREAPFMNSHDNLSTELLSKYRIVDYITPSNMERISRNGESVYPSASSYFSRKGHQHILDLNPSQSSNEQFSKTYTSSRKFGHPFAVCFFDTFIVIEIFLSNEENEFLVLAPRRTSSLGGDKEAIISGLLSGSQVIELLEIMSETPRNLCVFALLIDHVLVELS